MNLEGVVVLLLRPHAARSRAEQAWLPCSLVEPEYNKLDKVGSVGDRVLFQRFDLKLYASVQLKPCR